MRKNALRDRKLKYRALYAVCYVVMYPFVFASAIGSKIWGQHYSSDTPSNRHIFDETAARLNATLPWMYYV